MGGGTKSRRYEKTEEAILTVFFDNPNCTMWQLAKKTGIARSTIYTHHRSIERIMPDCENNILAEYDFMLGKKLEIENIELRKLFFYMLVFIVRNRQTFELFLKFGNREVVIKMIGKARAKIVSYAKFPKNYEKMFRVYEGEVVELIFDWGRKDFSEKELMRVLSDIMYLTDTARARLMPICD